MKNYFPLLIFLFFTTKILYAQQNLEDFVFQTKDGVAFLTQYNGESNIVKIPSVYKGMQVTAIAAYLGSDKQKHGVFEGLDIDSIILPSTIIRIGNNTFYNCEKLKNIALPPSINIIGESAFEGCTNLQKMDIPKGVFKISNRLFADCSHLKQVIIPNSVTSIGDEVFADCSSLTQITIPKNVTKIGFAVFAECNKLIELKVEALKPPVVPTGFLDNTSEQLRIKVPQSQVNMYKKSSGWSEYAKQIVGYQ